MAPSRLGVRSCDPVVESNFELEYNGGMRTLRRIVLVLAAAYLALLAGLFVLMRHPTLFGKVMAKTPEPLMMTVPFRRLWFLARRGALSAGDMAPDFRLSTPDKKAQVELSSFRGHKPVVLIFGSYT